jgi:hypothetical protein
VYSSTHFFDSSLAIAAAGCSSVHIDSTHTSILNCNAQYHIHMHHSIHIRVSIANLTVTTVDAFKGCTALSLLLYQCTLLVHMYVIATLHIADQLHNMNLKQS